MKAKSGREHWRMRCMCRSIVCSAWPEVDACSVGGIA